MPTGVKRAFKSMADFKPVAKDEAERSADLLVIPGAVEVQTDAAGNSMLVFALPLTLNVDQVNMYDEEVVDRQGAKGMVAKGNVGIAWDIPEGVEFSINDPATGDTYCYQIKRGGMAKSRRLYFGFDPTKGYRRIAATSDVSENDILEQAVAE